MGKLSKKIKTIMLIMVLAAGTVMKAGGISAEETKYFFTPSQNYRLSFYEEFDGDELNRNEWNYRTGYTSNTGGVSLPRNVRVQDSKLYLDFKREDYNNDGIVDYTGGGIISKRHFGYGYYEVRAKLYGETPGLHQSFWTAGYEHPGDIEEEIAPASNIGIEIDGFEVDSMYANSDHPNGGNVAHGGHDWTKGLIEGDHISFTGNRTRLDTTQWFTCGYEWLPNCLRFYINGELRHTITFDENYRPHNVWLTALPTPLREELGGAPNNVPENAAMQVDYFKYYAIKTGANILGNGGFEHQRLTVPSDNPDGLPIAQNPDGWIETGDKDASYVSNWEKRSGYRALVHYAKTDYSVTTKQNLTNIPNGTYQLSAWVKSSGGQTKSVITAEGYGGEPLQVNIPQADIWTKVTIDNIPVSNESISIQIISQASANQLIRIDDMELSEIPDVDRSNAILIDNFQTGYTETSGTWETSNTIKGYQNSSTRYSTSSNAAVQWLPTIAQTGNYDVFFYKAVHAGDANATIRVTYTGGQKEISMDLTAGSSGWVYLGTYPFTAGNGGEVKLIASASYCRADAVALVPSVQEKVPNVQKNGAIVIDNFQTGYTEDRGTWETSDTIKGYNNSNTRFGTSDNATAQWLPTIVQTGVYDVFFYKAMHAGDSNAIVRVTYSGGQEEFSMDLTAGTSGWVYLGTYPFQAGRGVGVKLIASTKYCRADAVAFVPTDMPPASTIKPFQIPDTPALTAQSGSDGGLYYKASENVLSASTSVSKGTGNSFTGSEIGLTLPSERFFLNTRYAGTEEKMVFNIKVPENGTYQADFYTYYPMTETAERKFAILDHSGTQIKSAALPSESTGRLSMGTVALSKGTYTCVVSIDPNVTSQAILRLDTIRLTPVI